MEDVLIVIAVLAALLVVWYARTTVLIASEAREDAATAHAEQMAQQAEQLLAGTKTQEQECSPMPASYMKVVTADRKPALTLKRLTSR